MNHADATIQRLQLAALAGDIEFGDELPCRAARARVGGPISRGLPPPVALEAIHPRLLGELVAVRFAGLRREILRAMLIASAAAATPDDFDELAARSRSLWVPIAAQCNATIAVIAESLRERLGASGPASAPAEELAYWSRVLDDSLQSFDPDLHAHLTASIAGFEAEIPPERLCASYEDCERYGGAVQLLLANAATHQGPRDRPAPGLLGITAHCEAAVPFSIASLCLDFASGFPAEAGMRLVANHLRAVPRVEVEVVDGILRLAAEYLAARDPSGFAALCVRFPSCVWPLTP